MYAVLQLLKVDCERPTWEDVKTFDAFNDARCHLQSIPHDVRGKFRVVLIPKPVDPSATQEQIYVDLPSEAIGLIETPVPATNLSYWTIIDPARGVRVTCQQSLIGYDGPVVTVMHVQNGWLTTIRPREMEDGVVKVLVRTPSEAGRQPTVSLAGVSVHFNDLFDLEEDVWDNEY